MAIFGLGDDGATAVKDKKASKKSDSDDKPAAKKKDDNADAQEDEAKALLEKMQAKKEADECPFC